MGSRNKNTGENRSKRMANELNVAGSQVARGTSLHGTNEAFDKALRDEVKKGRKVAGTNIRHSFNALKNIDPNRLSEFRGGTKYSGDTAGTVNAQELREIGLERDKLANQRTYAGDQLGALESGNRFLGLNPTSGMGIMQSLKRNFTNPEAQRSYANTRNIARTLANMGPIGGILRGLSNSLFGTDLRPMQMEGMPMGNIDPRVAGFFGAAQGAPNTAFGYTESPLNMETYSPDYIADRLFNTYTAPAADPTTMTPMQPGEDMINVMPMKNPFGNPFSPAIVSDEQKKAFNAEFANNALGAYYNQFPPEQLIGAGIDPNNPILQTTTNRLTPGQIMGLEAQGMGAHVGGIGPYNTDSPFVQSALQGTNTSSGYDLTSGSSAQKTFDSLYNMQNYGITGGL